MRDRLGRPARQGRLEHAIADPVRAGRRRRIAITGAGGQLGRALAEAFADDEVLALPHGDWDITQPYPNTLPRPELVLHAGAWTDVDAAEGSPEGAFNVNEGGTRNVVATGASVVYFSSDYVFDGRKRDPYVESDEPGPISVYGESKLAGERAVERGWIVRSSWLFGPTGHNFVRTVLRLAAERDELAMVDDQRGCPTYVGHLAGAIPRVVELPEGVWHVAASGECSWADFAQEIVHQAGLTCAVRRISTEELGRPAPRPTYSVLRSERKGAPMLPDWRDGLSDCLARIEPR